MILPQGADNYELAAMCEHAGTALVLRPHDVTTATLITAIRKVLTTDSFTAAGRACAADIASMPDAAATAAALRAWVSAS